MSVMSRRQAVAAIAGLPSFLSAALGVNWTREGGPAETEGGPMVLPPSVLSVGGQCWLYAPEGVLVAERPDGLVTVRVPVVYGTERDVDVAIGLARTGENIDVCVRNVTGPTVSLVSCRVMDTMLPEEYAAEEYDEYRWGSHIKARTDTACRDFYLTVREPNHNASRVRALLDTSVPVHVAGRDVRVPEFLSFAEISAMFDREKPRFTMT